MLSGRSVVVLLTRLRPHLHVCEYTIFEIYFNGCANHIARSSLSGNLNYNQQFLTFDCAKEHTFAAKLPFEKITRQTCIDLITGITIYDDQQEEKHNKINIIGNLISALSGVFFFSDMLISFNAITTK